VQAWDKNPRRLTPEGMRNLATSLERFGLAEPLVIQPNGDLIGGHARLESLKNAGETEVQCMVPNRALTDIERSELAVRLNKNIAGEWDTNLLESSFEAVKLMEYGFQRIELLDIGFEECNLPPIEQMETASQLPKGNTPIDDAVIRNKLNCTCPRCGYQFEETANE